MHLHAFCVPAREVFVDVIFFVVGFLFLLLFLLSFLFFALCALCAYERTCLHEHTCLLSVHVRAFCMPARGVLVSSFYFIFVLLFCRCCSFLLLFVFVCPVCVRSVYERNCLRGSIPACSLSVYVSSVRLRVWC